MKEYINLIYKAILMVLLCCFVLMAWIPQFNAADTLKVNGVPLSTNNDSIIYPSPEFADWDGDGLDDLILGYWNIWKTESGVGSTDGRVRFYKNIGTAEFPVYEDKGNLKYRNDNMIENDIDLTGA